MKTRSKKDETPKADLMIRAATLDVRKADGDTPAQVRMSVSSETPVLTYIYYNREYQRAYEILDHSPESVDLSRCADGLVLLDQHYGDQVGLLPVEIKDRKLGGGPAEFCSGQRAQDIGKDAAKGLRRNISVGYRVNAESYTLEGEKDGIPVVRAMSWMPYEASFEPVPADTTVGVNRADQTIAANAARSNKMSDKPEVKLDAESVVEIYRLARAFSIEPGQADDHIKSGKTVEEFRSMALKKAEADQVEMQRKLEEAKTRKPDAPAIETRAATTPKTVDDPAMTKEIQKRFSVMRVVRHLDATMRGERSAIDVGFEREISDELGKRSGKPAQGFYIPHNAPVLMGRADPFLKTSNGANFVATDLRVGDFIEALRTRMVLADAGVTTLSGLVGDVAIPKGGTITGGWIDGENGAGTEGKPTVTQVTGTPKTASGWCDISRRLMIQSSVDVEAFVQNELFNTVARLIEVAAFAGTNANGQPKGLTGQSGVNNPSVTANGPTRAEMLAFLSDIESDNADFPNQSWIVRPTGWAMLANRLEVAGVDNAGAQTGTIVGGGPVPGYLLDVNTNTMLGSPVRKSMNVPNHAIFFGAWSQLVIGLWSGLDLLVDPYSNSTTGATRIVALQDADIMVRHGQAFAYNAALTE